MASSSCACVRGERRGFTLIEILVVVSIMVVLFLLLLPAVQQAREAALRIKCMNNLRQIGLAFQGHYENYRCYPSNGGYASIQPFAVQTNGANWGVGVPFANPRYQPGSWAYAILPYMEQHHVYRDPQTGKPVWGAEVKLYRCPSRGRQIVLNVPPEDDTYYGPHTGHRRHTYANAGINPWCKTDYAANLKAVRNGAAPRVCLKMDDFADGAGHTIIVGEKCLDPRWYNSGYWHYEEPAFTGGSNGTGIDGDEVHRDAVGVPWELNWGSAHRATAQLLFADGTVRRMRFGTSPLIVAAALHPADGKRPRFDD